MEGAWRAAPACPLFRQGAPSQAQPPQEWESSPPPPGRAPSQLFWTSPVPRVLCKAKDFLRPGGPQLRSHVCEMRGEAGCGRALAGPLPPGSSGAWGWGAELLPGRACIHGPRSCWAASEAEAWYHGLGDPAGHTQRAWSLGSPLASPEAPDHLHTSPLYWATRSWVPRPAGGRRHAHQ